MEVDQVAETKPPGIEEMPPPYQRPLRRLELPLPKESYWTVGLCLIAAIAVAVGFFCFIHRYDAKGPSDIGIDENAYLVGGKMLAQHGTPALRPTSPFAFVGPMWILTANGAYSPKYPVGVPLLNAVAIWIGGSPAAAYWVSPICGVISVLAIFFCVRVIAGSVCGVLASILLASNPSVLHFSLVPSSHAPDLAFTMLGMTALFYWWRSGRSWGRVLLGIIAGLCIGFTVAIRYSDGLLLLPLGVAALTTVRFRDRRAWRAAAVPVAAWCVPFVALLIFNRVTMGHWTGYDTTNESTGFSAKFFAEKWQYTIHQLDIYGLFFLLPLGVLGMLLMLIHRRWWKPGLVLLLWFAPSTLLYTAYYWGLGIPGLMYLRFFVAVYPAAIIGAIWLIAMAVRGMASADAGTGEHAANPRIGLYLGATLFTAIIAAEGIYVARDDLQHLYALDAGVSSAGRALLDAIPACRAGAAGPAPLMFGEDLGFFSRQLLHFQFIARGEWFATTAFTPRGDHLALMFGNGGAGNDPNSPNPPVLIQKERLVKNGKLYGETTIAGFAKSETDTITAALKTGREVYAVLMPSAAPDFLGRLSDEGFQSTLLSTWHDPSAIRVPPIVVHKPTTAPATLAMHHSPPHGESKASANDSDNDGFFSHLFSDNTHAAPQPPRPDPFGGNTDNLTLPTLRLPRMFDTATDLQIFQIKAK